MTPWTEQSCWIVEPRAGRVALAAGVIGGGLAALAALGASVLPAPLAAPGACVPLFVGAALAADLLTRMPQPVGALWQRRRQVAVSAGPEGLGVEDRPAVPRAQIRRGVLFPLAGGACLAVLDRGLAPALRLELPSAAEGHALLRALGLDAGQSALTVAVPWPREASSPGLLVALALAALGTAATLAAGPLGAPWLTEAAAAIWALLALHPLAAAALWRSEITVGREELRRRVGARVERLALAEIAAVSLACEPGAAHEDTGAEGLALVLHDGRRLTWMIDDAGSDEPGALLIAVRDRLQAALAARRAGGAAARGPVPPPRRAAAELAAEA
jgi:hypothetical protein